MLDAYISLGFNCEAGLQFRRIGYEESSIFRFSFIHDFNSLNNLLLSDFDSLFCKENLESINNVMVHDRKSGISFHSKLAKLVDAKGDVPIESRDQFDQIYLDEKSKIDYLVDKWRTLVSSEKKVAYFYKSRDVSSKSEAQALLNTFSDRYPSHDFVIVYIQEKCFQEPAWGLERLHNVYLDFFAPFDEVHDADERGWDIIFANYPCKTEVMPKNVNQPICNFVFDAYRKLKSWLMKIIP